MGKATLVQRMDGKCRTESDLSSFEASLRIGEQVLKCDLCKGTVRKGGLYMGMFGALGHKKCVDAEDRSQMREILANPSEEEEEEDFFE